MGEIKTPQPLVCAVNQQSSVEVEKLKWLETFKLFLANTHTTRSGILILTGDFNINLLNHQNESTDRYKNILHTFSMQ